MGFGGLALAPGSSSIVSADEDSLSICNHSAHGWNRWMASESKPLSAHDDIRASECEKLPWITKALCSSPSKGLSNGSDNGGDLAGSTRKA